MQKQFSFVLFYLLISTFSSTCFSQWEIVPIATGVEITLPNGRPITAEEPFDVDEDGVSDNVLYGSTSFIKIKAGITDKLLFQVNNPFFDLNKNGVDDKIDCEIENAIAFLTTYRVTGKALLSAGDKALIILSGYFTKEICHKGFPDHHAKYFPNGDLDPRIDAPPIIIRKTGNVIDSESARFSNGSELLGTFTSVRCRTFKNESFCFFSSRTGQSKFLRVLPNNTFEDMTAAVGLPFPMQLEPFGVLTYGVADGADFVDLNEDDVPDLIIVGQHHVPWCAVSVLTNTAPGFRYEFGKLTELYTKKHLNGSKESVHLRDKKLRVFSKKTDPLNRFSIGEYLGVAAFSVRWNHLNSIVPPTCVFLQQEVFTQVDRISCYDEVNGTWSFILLPGQTSQFVHEQTYGARLWKQMLEAGESIYSSPRQAVVFKDGLSYIEGGILKHGPENGHLEFAVRRNVNSKSEIEFLARCWGGGVGGTPPPECEGASKKFKWQWDIMEIRTK